MASGKYQHSAHISPVCFPTVLASPAIRSVCRQDVCVPGKVFFSQAYLLAAFPYPVAALLPPGGETQAAVGRGGDCPEDPSVRKSENG